MGDCFLTEFETFIRLYGFVHQPYVLTTILTVRIFSLELIKQRLIVEEEHIMSFRKRLGINFPWGIGPYTVKNRTSLPLVDSFLKSMGFSLGQAINYDPHQIIYKRRQDNKNNPFKHTEIAEIREVANWEYYPNYATKDINMEQGFASSLP